MLPIWRGLVWTIGSLSVAVLLRDAFDAPVAPIVRSVLDAYAAALASATAPLEPLVTRLLSSLKEALGAGATLYSHWTHVFVIALLHMLPRADATFGTTGLAAGALWTMQAFVALALALVCAAYVGGAPFVAEASEEGMFVALFIASAFLINAVANDGDDGEAEEAPGERSEFVDRWPLRYAFARAFTFAVILAVICSALVGLMFGWLDQASAERMSVALILTAIALAFAFFLAQLIYRAVNAERDDALFLNYGVLPGTALLFMFLSLLPLSDQLSPGIASSPIAYMAIVAAVPVASGWWFARQTIGRLIGRDDGKYDARGTAALGMFIAGGAAIVVIGSAVS
jgi:hypothetical protein